MRSDKMQEDGSWQFDYRACELEVLFQLGGGGERACWPPIGKLVVLCCLRWEVVVPLDRCACRPKKFF